MSGGGVGVVQPGSGEGKSLYSEIEYRPGGGRGKGDLCFVRSNTSWVMVIWDSVPHMNRQTQQTENITF